MGCFTACFRNSNHKKIIKSSNHATSPSKNQSLQSLLQTHDVNEVIIKAAQIEDTIKPIADSKDEEEEHLNRSSRKKVTFDLNVKTYEECSKQEDKKSLEENKRDKGNDQKKERENESEISSDSSLISFPLNHRYHDCSNGDGELEHLWLEDIDLEDDGVGGCNENGLIQEESSESLFSLSIESRKSVSQPEMPDKEEVSSPLKPFKKEAKTIGLNPNARDRSQFVQSVLNPIENMSQWKAAKAKTASPLEPQEKENQNHDLEQGLTIAYSEGGPNFRHRLKRKENEIVVDTSLSSWLVESEKKTPNSKDSSGSTGNSPSDQRRKSSEEFEERPILGALCVEEFKVLSKSSSPRRSPRTSPDDMLIIGTVGSYWRHTGQATDSDSGSSCRGISGGSRRGEINQSTPFQTRLESAVENGIIARV